MREIFIKDAIRLIGLALNATHNTIATDIVGVEPDEKSWRVDNSKEIDLLGHIEKYLLSNDICLVCCCRNKSLLSMPTSDHQKHA